MIFADQALFPTGWASNVRISIVEDKISEVETNAEKHPGDLSVRTLIPGMNNLHSHAFQRGFSGLTETRGTGTESFWTWRDMMYRFALNVSPDDLKALADMAYIEMLEAGYTRVGEFHYLHNDVTGQRYRNPAEMSERIFEAASNTGIALTHLPVFYAHGGFGPQKAHADQRRFLNTVDDFVKLINACDSHLNRPQDRVGYAPHSLRAATQQDLTALHEYLPNRPVHIHIAEQTKEVEDCQNAYQSRPVEWLFDNLNVDEHWCLVHATHINSEEIDLIAQSGAVAGLCPITEANLGDGIFPAKEYLDKGGRFGLGTDSNIRISVAEEIQLLEYSQRFAHQQRNVLTSSGGSTGSQLFNHALKGGAQALGADQPAIAKNAYADLVALNNPLTSNTNGDDILNRWIFGKDVSVDYVWAAGTQVVQNGRHVKRDGIVKTFDETLKKVLSQA